MTACTGPSESAPPAAPYGTWTSPLTAERVTAGSLRFDHIVLDRDDVHWVEGRASEGGRYVVVRRTPDGRIVDITPPEFNVRSRVHEYGGAAYTVHQGTVFFSNFSDQRLHRQSPGQVPVPITPPGYFYADCAIDAARNRLLCVREDHTKSDAEPINTIVALEMSSAEAVDAGSAEAKGHPSAAAALGTPPGLALRTSSAGSTDRTEGQGFPALSEVEGSPGRVLASGADFYSDPVLSADGTQIAWLQWNHPNMPWDGTELWVAGVAANGGLTAREKVAGGADESIFQPSWSPDGLLYFVSDRTGWWNLYRRGGAGIEPIHPMPAEFGKAQWTFSMSTYAFITATRLAVTYTQDGRWRMALVEIEPRRFEPIALSLEPLDSIRATTREVYFIGGSPTTPPAIARMTLAAAESEVLRASSSDAIDPAWISVPEAITFPSENGQPVHAFHYAPRNPQVSPPPDEKPPLLVVTHGGPTGASEAILDARIQFWTSRGFAVLDVNCGGSTGYGRPYRDRLKGQWGIVDVADAVNGARYLVAQGKADPNRLAIRGGSAGGYTTLAALTFYDVFKAGASYYGISDIEVLARDTHKFEARYLDSLVGPYPARKDLYVARSPIHFADKLSSALILFQGLEDKVVPPNQSQMMADAVRRKGLPVAYIPFEGEQHGFRQEKNIVRSLEAELYFYGAVFGFTPADAIEPVAIDNLR